jgi:ParB-like chromosome segregation protein Spo0J
MAGRVSSAGEPIIVRPTDEDHYEVVAGERRYRVAIARG